MPRMMCWFQLRLGAQLSRRETLSDDTGLPLLEYGGARAGAALGCSSLTPPAGNDRRAADCRATRWARIGLLCCALLGALVLLSVLVGSASADTAVTSNITSNTTWTAAGSPYDLDRQGTFVELVRPSRLNLA